jgi:hypothetical protein
LPGNNGDIPTTGELFYNALSMASGSEKAASLALREASIPGHRYLDGQSRDKGEGTHNYVIYDGGDMKIQETYYQFAGQRSNVSEELREALGRAVSLREGGTPNEEIFKETGWFTGMDGQWRYEIPDNLEKVSFPEDRASFSLSEVYDNPALYRAYPGLKGLDVLLAESSGARYKPGFPGNGQFLGYSPQIEIDESLTEDEKASALIHELQHAIQDIEGFASGGNPGMFSSVTDERAVESARERFHAILGDKKREERFFEIEGIRKRALERREIVDALNGEIDKLDLDDDAVAARAEADGLFTSEQEAEELYRNALESLEYFENALRRDIGDEAYREAHTAYHTWAVYPPEITPIAQYENLAGEIEARDAASRAAGDRGVMPDLRNNAIIIYGGNIMASFNSGQTGRDMPRGAIDFTNPNAVTITLTPRSDATTTLHEMGHLFRWLLEQQAAAFPDDDNSRPTGRPCGTSGIMRNSRTRPSSTS